MFLDPNTLFMEIKSNLRFAFPNYETGFWARTDIFPFYELDWQTDLGLLSEIPSSIIPFPLATKEKSNLGYRDDKHLRKQVVESAAKLNLDDAIKSATTISPVQQSALVFEPQNERLLFSRVDSPLGKFVTLR